jgi:acetylornithine/succinyldiaminopimelate/putrescine aminotransferase
MNRVRTNMKGFPDIHFCCDEVQGGMGRTGKLFAHNWYEPEIKSEFVAIGKMLGGGLPLSAILGPREILTDPLIEDEAHLHSTHSGNPFICNVGCAVVERIQKEFMVDRSHELGLLMETCLKDIKQKHHCGRGLLAGIEFEGPLMASVVVKACRRRGLLVVDTGRKWVKLGPQLNITAEEIVTGCGILKAAIEEVENDIEAQRDTSAEPDKVDTGLQEPGVRDLPEDGKPPSAEDA